VYVGRTGWAVSGRIADHRKRGKIFTSYEEFSVPTEHVQGIEAALIHQMQPPYNYTQEASGMKGDQWYMDIFFQQHPTAIPTSNLMIAPLEDLADLAPLQDPSI
jgi:hypothetical protein